MQGSAIAVSTNAADALSAQNWSANLRALRDHHANLVERVQSLSAHVQWTFGKDRQLTAKTSDGKWWHGCSVPRAAAGRILSCMQNESAVSIFLDPQHAALLRVALDHLQSHQAVIAIVPEAQTLRVLLACEDFSGDITSHRLWFVSGDDWANQLRSLLNDHPGLATPTQFIRTRLSNEAVLESLITSTQQLLGPIIESRNRRQQELSRQRNPDGKACLIASSQFRLWDDGSTVLKELAEQANIEIEVFDPSDPLSASTLALAERASACRCILSANLPRQQLAGVVSADSPWINWSTRPTGATLQNEPDQTLAFAWPVESSMQSPVAPAHLAILCDTQPIEQPKTLADYSTNVLLWEKIEHDLKHNPLSLQGDAALYIARQQRDLGITGEHVDVGLLIERLVLPLYQQQLARLLQQAGIAIRLFGKGWDAIEGLSSLAQGPVKDRRHLRQIVGQATALLYAWPFKQAHPIQAFDRPIVYPSPTASQLITTARNALSCPFRVEKQLENPLSAELLKKFIPPRQHAR